MQQNTNLNHSINWLGRPLVSYKLPLKQIISEKDHLKYLIIRIMFSIFGNPGHFKILLPFTAQKHEKVSTNFRID